MEKGFERLCCNRADRDLTAMLGVTLSVAVQVLERLALDIQRFEGCLLVPLRHGGRLIIRAFSLGQGEPVGFQREMSEGELFIALGSFVGGYGPCALAGNRHP